MINCNQPTISRTEEFLIQAFGHAKAIKGHEKDMWCTHDKSGLVSCGESEIGSEAMKFGIIQLPAPGEMDKR